VVSLNAVVYDQNLGGVSGNQPASIPLSDITSSINSLTSNNVGGNDFVGSYTLTQGVTPMIPNGVAWKNGEHQANFTWTFTPQPTDPAGNYNAWVMFVLSVQ
jgi:hypothetical protein